MNYHNAEFIKSAAAQTGFIDDGLPQIVFAGKSNVGKSSVINRLLNRKNFARKSSQPGKTVHINYFLIDGSVYFVDLPGYGYAKAAKSERDRWGRLMEAYFGKPGRITLGVMIVDARHAPTKDDVTMARWFKSSGRPFAVAANKTDKVRGAVLASNLEVIREILELSDTVKIIPFSAEKGGGREELAGVIEEHVIL